MIFVILVAGLAVWQMDPYGSKGAKDEDLIKIFHDHRQAFETLKNMAIEDHDSVSRFSASTLPESNLKPARQQDYLRLLSEINPGLVETVEYTEVVRFIFPNPGSTANGPVGMKVITYIPNHYERYGTITSNLDEKGAVPDKVYMRPIEPHWFLVYQGFD